MQSQLDSDLTAYRIRDFDHPLAETGYRALDDYFGERGEMETREVIRQRFDWDPARPIDGVAFLYEMVVVLDADGEVAAVRDYSITLDIAGVSDRGLPAVVHLSHIRVLGRHVGRSILPRLHPYPIEAAREALERAGLPVDTPVVLAGEVEHPEPGNEERTQRLRLFQRAKFRPAAPDLVPFVQPDFRPPEAIERDGGPQPLSLILMLWRVGREDEETVDAAEIRHIVRCLYAMYGQSMWPSHMQPVLATLADYPPPGTPVSLSWSNVFDD
jgi:hypothetical protein